MSLESASQSQMSDQVRAYPHESSSSLSSKSNSRTTTRTISDDETMRRYIVDGYLTVKTAHPPEFHQALLEQAEGIITAEGNPGNNLLPRIPALREVFADPRVADALATLLGPDYFLPPHRYCHLNPPGAPGQRLHRDGFCTRRHHTRAAMVFYYPQ